MGIFLSILKNLLKNKEKLKLLNYMNIYIYALLMHCRSEPLSNQFGILAQITSKKTS